MSLPSKNLVYKKWDEYGGIPNHFKIKLYIEEKITNSDITEINNNIEEYKRLSSKFDGLEITIRPKTQIELNPIILTGNKILITE